MANDRTQRIKVEYGEAYIDKDDELELFAACAANVRVLDATPVGDQIRLRYTIIWENGT